MSEFHFLRPLWLLLLPATAFVYWAYRRRRSSLRQWADVVAPHLLRHLLIGAEQQHRARPIHLLVAVLALVSLALAGPTWKRESTPFTEDQAPLVVALDLSQSMNAIDIRPTRLERAQQKVRDLLALRSGARTALLAYAGSAHMVLPLTDDARILETYLASLNSDMMPLEGKEPSQALALAQAMMDREPVPGTILFLTDGIGNEHLPIFIEHSEGRHDQIMVLGIGTSDGGPIRLGEDRFLVDAQGQRVVSRLDREGLEALSKEAQVYVTTATVDDSDVRRLQRRIQSHLQAVQSQDENLRWQDLGYYLLLPAVVLAAFWFRRGWTLRWDG